MAINQNKASCGARNALNKGARSANKILHEIYRNLFLRRLDYNSYVEMYGCAGFVSYLYIIHQLLLSSATRYDITVIYDTQCQRNACMYPTLASNFMYLWLCRIGLLFSSATTLSSGLHSHQLLQSSSILCGYSTNLRN